MSSITKNKTWADNDNVLYTDLNGNFDTIYNDYNGSITDANISGSAAIAASKIAGVVTTATAQSITGKKTFQATVATLVSDSDGATITFDLSAGNIHQVTLAGNRTLALSNASTGQVFVIRLVQDGTGTRTVTWFSTVKWANGITPTLTTTLNKTDVFSFICTGTNTYDGFIVGQNL
jgi:hypothetical protein